MKIMMIFVWANKYFIWINQFKTKYSFEQRHSVDTSLRMNREIPHSQLSYLKVTDLDQYIFMPRRTHSSKRQISKL